MYQEYYDKAIAKIVRNSRKIGARFPHVAVNEDGSFNEEPRFFWTGGFWAGMLWLAYRETHQLNLFETACEIEDKLDEPLDQFLNIHHDVGFMWTLSALAHYRMTGCEKSRVRCLKAASHLAGRFNLAGRYIRAWNDPRRVDVAGTVIIDSMMNLPLLFWASKETGDPRFKHLAVAHANTVITKMLRSDNTVPHIAVFDENSGEKKWNLGGQGKAPDSIWSRGQAWAIYGFAIAYRECGDPIYLETAKKIATKFMSLLPDDGIPYWDFCAEESEKFVKDTSAACCAASGMLEIAKLCEDEVEAERFKSCAETLLSTIAEKCSCFDDQTQGIVKYGTVNYPKGQYINVPIIYGDFFFVEALSKLQDKNGLF